MTRNKGFTLIELLVVIAIIAILAAILFPVFAAAQNSAKLAKCQNNMKQICSATMSYEGDYHGRMMPGFSSGTWGDWYDMLNPYLRQMNKDSQGYNLRGVWRCPQMPVSRMISGGAPIGPNLERCYGYNYAYLGGWPIPGTSPVQYETHVSSEVVKATMTVRVMEIWSWDKANQATQAWGTAYCYPPVKSSLSKPNGCWPPGWHAGRSTVGWCDGHVSTVKLVPPRPLGANPTDADYTGIMQKTLPGVPNSDDPYFRLAYPKP